MQSDLYTKPPECVDIIHRTSGGFPSWAPAGKTE